MSWDTAANEADSLFPEKVTLHSCKEVHWVCGRCSVGQPINIKQNYIQALQEEQLPILWWPQSLHVQLFADCVA